MSSALGWPLLALHALFAILVVPFAAVSDAVRQVLARNLQRGNHVAGHDDALVALARKVLNALAQPVD